MATTRYPNMVEPLVNRNLGKCFHHKNGPNKCYYIHKQVGYLHQPIQNYQPWNFSPPHLKDKCQCCGLNNKEVREILIQDDSQLEKCPFSGPLFIKKKDTREHLLKINHKHGSIPKYFNKDRCNLLKSTSKKGDGIWKPIYKLAPLQLVETYERFSKKMMRDLPTKKMIVRESLAVNYLQKHFQWLECDLMTSHWTGRFAGSDSDQAGKTGPRYVQSEVFQLPYPFKSGTTTCQDKCRKRVLKVIIQTRKRFFGSSFLDVIMWRFVDILKAIRDKRLISKNVIECWTGYLFWSFWKKSKYTSEWVSKYTGICFEGYCFHTGG